MEQNQELSQKEKLLRIIKATGKKRKVKKSKVKLSIEGTSSEFLEGNINSISYRDTPSLKVRGVMRKIVQKNGIR